MLPRITTTSRLSESLDTPSCGTGALPSSSAVGGRTTLSSLNTVTSSIESLAENHISRITKDNESDQNSSIDTDIQRKRKLSILSSAATTPFTSSSLVSSSSSTAVAQNYKRAVSLNDTLPTSRDSSVTSSSITETILKSVIPTFNFHSSGNSLSVALPDNNNDDDDDESYTKNKGGNSTNTKGNSNFQKFISSNRSDTGTNLEENNKNVSSSSSSPPSTSSVSIHTPLKQNHHHHHYPNNSKPFNYHNSSTDLASNSTVSSPSHSLSSSTGGSLSPLHQIYEALTTNGSTSSSSSLLPLQSSNPTTELRIKKISTTNDTNSTLVDDSNNNALKSTHSNDTPTPVSGTPLPFIQSIHTRHIQNHQSSNFSSSNNHSIINGCIDEKTSSSGGTMIVTPTTPSLTPTVTKSTVVGRKPVYTVESLLAMVPPLHEESYVRYVWGLVCACNVNRSMSAHLSLANQGFTKVYSYGTADLVRLPSRFGPIPFYFGTSYSSILSRLCSPYPEDSVWVTATGLRNMLERDANVKYCPQQWQSLISGGGPKASECGLIPQYIATNNIPIMGTKQVGEKLNTVRVIDHDFVICFDLKVYEQVIIDLHYRGFLPSSTTVSSPTGNNGTSLSSLSSSNDVTNLTSNSIIHRLLLGNNPSFYAMNTGMAVSSNGSTANASSIPENSTTGINAISNGNKKRVHVILLHTRDNLADAAIAGRLATLLAHSICYAIEQKEQEYMDIANNNSNSSILSESSSSLSNTNTNNNKRINRLWKLKFQQKLSSLTTLNNNHSTTTTTNDPIDTTITTSPRTDINTDTRMLSSSSTLSQSSTNRVLSSLSTTGSSSQFTVTETNTVSDNENNNDNTNIGPRRLLSPSPIDVTMEDMNINPTETEESLDYIELVRNVLRDIEYKLDLPHGSMLYEEWYCYTNNN